MKKVLSIVLSIVMVLCMMPAMAFAGTAAVFTDEAAINHDAAVDTLVALGVFEGYPDGSFQPAKVVTRAEMAKTIATVLNGGEAPVLSASTTSYTDTKGHWAAPYIEYCTSLGIVEGVGNGAFSPDAPVTAEAAAKMMLVAQGYNAAVEGMTGGHWASNTNVLANANGYYAELADIKTEEGAAREHVAQMLYNALDAKVIAKSNSVNKETGAITTIYEATGESVATKYFDLATSATEGTINKIEYSTKKAEYSYYLVDAKGAAVDTIVTKADYTSLYKMPVKVLESKDGKVVYGMFPNEATVVYEGLFGDITSVDPDKDTAVIAGETYKVNDGVTLAAETAVAEFGAANPYAIAAYSEIKLIDTNNDGKIDTMTYSPVEVDRVDFVGATTFMTDSVFKTATKFTEETIVLYDGIAADDYVVIVKDLELGKTVITKLEALDNAKVTSKTGTTSAVIGGTTYKLADTVAVGKSYDAGIINGYVVLAEEVGASFNFNNYGIVTAKSTETTTTHDGVVETTRVLMANGETKVVELDRTAKDYAAAATNTCTKGTASGLVKLSEVTGKAGKYTVAAVTDGTDVDVTFAIDTVNDTINFTKKTDDKAANINNIGIASDAVVFVATADAKDNVTYSIITGAELAEMTDVEVDAIATKTSATTGYDSVVMALVSSVEAKTANYAVVYGATSTTEVSAGKYVYEYNLSTGKFKSPETNLDPTTVGKGNLVSYNINSKGEIVDVVVIDAKMNTVPMVGYDGTKLSINWGGKIGIKAYDIDKDAVTMFVDSSDNNKVYETGKIRLAEGTTKNVRVMFNEKSDVVLLVVDVNNKMV